MAGGGPGRPRVKRFWMRDESIRDRHTAIWEIVERRNGGRI